MVVRYFSCSRSRRPFPLFFFFFFYFCVSFLTCFLLVLSTPEMGKFFKEREEGVYLYAHWLANYPWLVILVVLSVSALLIGLAFRTPFVLDSGGAGFVPRSDPVGIRKDSLLAAIDYSYFSSQISAGMPPTVIQVQQSVPGPTIAFIYEKNARATSPNVLSDAAIDEMRAFEVAFAARPNFTDYCLKIGGVCAQPFSLQNFFWPPNGRGTGMSCWGRGEGSFFLMFFFSFSQVVQHVF